ncbi:hypothetical protein [Nonomuraea salmonea]|uniref:hypothetical protein n=1 Tax=Nonomuraea salmonea TaxID=46181 RepID=UPI002FED1372
MTAPATHAARYAADQASEVVEATRYRTSAVGTYVTQIAPAATAPVTVASTPVTAAKASTARDVRRRRAIGRARTAPTGHAAHAGHHDDGPGGSATAYLMISATTIAVTTSVTIHPSSRCPPHFMPGPYRPPHRARHLTTVGLSASDRGPTTGPRVRCDLSRPYDGAADQDGAAHV